MTGTHPPTLTLYFIADNPSVEHNRDLFTWASSLEEALADWQKNYETTDLPDGLFPLPTDKPVRGPVPWNILRTELLS